MNTRAIGFHWRVAFGTLALLGLVAGETPADIAAPILAESGVLFLLVDLGAEEPPYADMPRVRQAYRGKFWDERLMAFERLESAWPVHGNILVHEGEAWFAAGRSAFLDGGMWLWRLDAATGRTLSKTVLDDIDPATGKPHQDFVRWLNMPAALPNVLSTDGRWMYMRSQLFELDGTRLPLESMPDPLDADQGAPPPEQRDEFAHLFSPTGFLDDTW